MIGCQMIVGSITLFPLSLAFEIWEVNWTSRLVAAFLYTAIFPGLLATLIWFKLLHFLGPIKAAAFHFLNPFFGVLIAHIILSEKLTVQQLVGVSLVTLAIMLLQFSNISKTVK
jgi:drug/metabolite transporter (DMT)-like permease